MNQPPPLLEAQQITRRLPEGVTLVQDASLKVERGEFIAIDRGLAMLKPGDQCLVLVDQVQEALDHLAKRIAEA